jgi:hypothetical protein
MANAAPPRLAFSVLERGDRAEPQLARRLLSDAILHVCHDGHLGLVTKADELAPLVAGHLRPG